MTMPGSTKPLGALLARFRQNNQGQIAVILGLSILPIMGFIGTAIDYARATTTLASLNAAADAAALNAVSKGRTTKTAPSTDTVKGYFNGSAGVNSYVTVTNFSTTSTVTVTSMTVSVSYTAQIPTAFMQLFGVKTLTMSGGATAQTSLPPYIDFHLLLDNSPSMGVAGSTSDITKMQSLTSDSCAFACHKKNSDGSENTNDYYHLAKNNGITTCIDLLRSAVQNLMDTATKSTQITNQFRMGIYTFSDTFQTIADLSSDLTTQKSKAAAIDLAYAYAAETDQQTSFDLAMPTMNSIVADPGDGTVATAPQKFVFFVTDGVQDEVKTSKNTCLSSTPKADSSGNNSCVSQKSPHDSSTTTIGPINSSLCTTLKNRGIKVAVLYTPYLPLTVNSYYNTYVAPYNNSSTTGIEGSLAACASPGFYFSIGDSTSINSAMNAMFQAAVKYARLTN